MRFKVFSAFLSIILFCAVCTGFAYRSTPSAKEAGLSASQLKALVDALPPLPGNIEAIQFLRDGGARVNRVAILTNGEASGWQILVLHIESSGKFAFEWSSGKLDDSFVVSSADQFQAYRLSDEQVLRFSGCAAHDCPDVFSVMIYVPSKKAAFTATSVFGKISYSPSGDGPMYRYYKMDLVRFLAEHHGVTR